ncbi:MAG: hypothetical protein LBD88_01240 [Candidatus Peribacteria bacterium]|nr:hypothetical protein [Candidatus Peribacteria bacterium]
MSFSKTSMSFNTSCSFKLQVTVVTSPVVVITSSSKALVSSNISCSSKLQVTVTVILPQST